MTLNVMDSLLLAVYLAPRLQGVASTTSTAAATLQHHRLVPLVQLGSIDGFFCSISFSLSHRSFFVFSPSLPAPTFYFFILLLYLCPTIREGTFLNNLTCYGPQCCQDYNDLTMSSATWPSACFLLPSIFYYQYYYCNLFSPDHILYLFPISPFPLHLPDCYKKGTNSFTSNETLMKTSCSCTMDVRPCCTGLVGGCSLETQVRERERERERERREVRVWGGGNIEKTLP